MSIILIVILLHFIYEKTIPIYFFSETLDTWKNVFSVNVMNVSEIWIRLKKGSQIKINKNK